MTLGELLGILRADILHDRSDLVAGDTDYLWSKSTLVRYIDEAQRRFARRTLCIRDGTTPSITQFKTVAFQKNYPLDPSILAIISARFMGNGSWVNGVWVGPQPEDKADLARAGHFQFDCYTIPDRYFFSPNELSTLPPGKPLAYDTDEFTTANKDGSMGIINFRAYPIPSALYAGCTIQMRVARLPKHLTPDNTEVAPEVPEEYHLDLLDYAAYLALRIVDHELGDPERAQEFLTTFEAKVDLARREMLRKMFAPSVWGFGRSGFSFVGN
jgi:hypothetical protein